MIPSKNSEHHEFPKALTDNRGVVFLISISTLGSNFGLMNVVLLKKSLQNRSSQVD